MPDSFINATRADDAEIERRAAAIGQSRGQFDNGANLIGTPEQVAERVARLRDLGAERVNFQLMDCAASITPASSAPRCCRCCPADRGRVRRKSYAFES